MGRELGWTGVALKTCKTQTGALLSACWAKQHGMTLMVQDLTNPRLAMIPHVQLAAHIGTIMGVECNAMQFYPDASAAEAKVLSAVAMPQVCETYTKDLADKYLNEGKIVIFGGGTGCPFFTTDTAAALRAIEIGADIALMAKAVDGVYDKDPRTNPDAKKFDAITYSEILDKKLGVIDLTAASLCMEKNMPVLLFQLGKGESIAEALCGNNVGTVINV